MLLASALLSVVFVVVFLAALAAGFFSAALLLASALLSVGFVVVFLAALAAGFFSAAFAPDFLVDAVFEAAFLRPLAGFFSSFGASAGVVTSGAFTSSAILFGLLYFLLVLLYAD